MHGLLMLFTDILLRRRGPQDVPVSRFLDGMVWGLAFVASALYAWLASSDGLWLVRAGADLVAGGVFTLGVLALFGHAARFRQTYTAQCGTAVLLTLPALAIGLLAQGGDASLAVVFRVLFTVLFVASLVVTEHIFRQALECTPWKSVPVTLANLMLALWVSRFFDAATPATT